MDGRDFIRTGNAYIQVFQDPVLYVVYPSMYSQRLTFLPCILYNSRVADICNLLDDIQFTEKIDLVTLIVHGGHLFLMKSTDILDMP